MKHFGEKVNLWVQYRCSLSHTLFSCSVTDSLLSRFPCHCIHTYISLRPNPPPPPPLTWKKKRNPHASTSHFPGFLVTKASLFRGTSTGRLAPRQRHTLRRLQKRAPPPPTPTQAECQSIGLAIRLPGLSPALATGWISSCSQSFSSSHPRPRLVIANWLPPASWGF